MGDAITAIDYALYPVLALLRRISAKVDKLDAKAFFPDEITEWMKKIEALPFYKKTIPPHWRE